MRFATAAIFCTGVFTVFCSTPSWALDEIYSPNVEQGEVSLEYNGSRTFDNNSAKNDAQEHEIALEYGVNSRWEVEGSAGFTRDPAANVELEDVEVENRVQFFEQGQYWLDLGLLVAFDDATHHGDANNLEVKLLMQKDIGRFTNTANIGFDQAVEKTPPAGQTMFSCGARVTAIANWPSRVLKYRAIWARAKQCSISASSSNTSGPHSMAASSATCTMKRRTCSGSAKPPPAARHASFLSMRCIFRKALSCLQHSSLYFVN